MTTKGLMRKHYKHSEHKPKTILRKMENGILHCVDGPAVVYPDGTEFWYQNGLLHREDGPASSRPDGSEEWFQNGQLHRENGPAVTISSCGIIDLEEWWQYGKRHRDDGPAIINYRENRESYWIRGKPLENQKYNIL